MKKTLLTLILSLTLPFNNANAAFSGFTYPSNDDDSNVLFVVQELRDYYMTTVGFPNLEKLDIKHLFPNNIYGDKRVNELRNKFSFSTKDNGRVAIIKYKAKSCENMKEMKEILLKKTLITEGEPTSCKNNVWTAELNN